MYTVSAYRGDDPPVHKHFGDRESAVKRYAVFCEIGEHDPAPTRHTLTDEGSDLLAENFNLRARTMQQEAEKQGKVAGRQSGSKLAKTVELHNRLLAFIDGYQHECGRKPTQIEMAKEFGMSQRGISKRIQQLVIEMRLIVPADKDGVYTVRG